MKTIPKLFSMALTAILLSASFSACSDDSGVVAEPESPDIVSDSGTGKYEVTINLGTNITSDVGPITRADENDGNLYAVLVQTVDSIYDSWGAYTQSYQYAYGVFDEAHKNDIRLTLDSDSIYSFYATKIVDAKNKIYHGEISGFFRGYETSEVSFVGYGYPFTVADELLNKFSYTDIEEKYPYTSNISIDNLYYGIYEVERYYGQVVNYKPTGDDKINIQMISLATGIQFNVKNLSEGESVTVSHISPNIVLTADNPSYEGIYCNTGFLDDSKLWNTWTQSEDGNIAGYDLGSNNVALTWTGADGEEKPLAVNLRLFSIPLKLYKKTIVNITLEGPDNADYAAGITLSEEDFTDADTWNMNSQGGIYSD